MDLGNHSAKLFSDAITAIRAGRFYAFNKFSCAALISVKALWPEREQRAEE